MNFFGHNLPFGKKDETAPSAPAEEVAASETAPVESVAAEAAISAPEQEVASVNPAASDLGAQADKLAAMIDSEVQSTGSPDVAVASVDANTPTIAEQVATLDTSEAAASVTEPTVAEYRMPSEIVANNAGLVTGQNTEAAPLSGQTIVEATEPTLGLENMTDEEVRNGFGLEPLPEQPQAAVNEPTVESAVAEPTAGVPIIEQEIPAKGQE